LKYLGIKVTNENLIQDIKKRLNTWSLTLREEDRVFGNKGLGKIFRPKSDEVMGG
jgi:hypothetical protein